MTTWILVNGIRTRPDDIRSWTDRAENFIEENKLGRAIRYEYFDLALIAPFRRARRVRDLRDLVASADGGEVNIIGHSNGCAIISRWMLANTTQKVGSICLLGAASPADCEKNGINHTLRHFLSDRIILGVSRQDRALAAAGWSFGLYGQLGFTGPLNPVSSPQLSTICRRCGHTAWTASPYIQEFIQAVAENRRLE